MKTSYNRVRQYVSSYDQSRIDAAIKKSDSRVISRAIADKAREESIKATTEYNKSLLDLDKSQIDLDKSLMDCEKSRLAAKKSQFDLEHMRLLTAKSQMDNEKIILLIEYKRLIDLQEPQSHEYKEQLFKENSIIQSNEDKDTYIKEQIETTKLQIAAKNVQIETVQLQIAAEKAQFDIDTKKYLAEKVRLDYNKSRFASEKTQFDTNKLQLERDKAKFNTDNANYLAEKDLLEINKSRFSSEKAKFDTIKSQFESEKAKFDTDNVNYLAEKDLLEINKSRFASEKANFDTDNANYLADKYILDTNKSRFASEKAKFDTDTVNYLADKYIIDTNKSLVTDELATNNIIHDKVEQSDALIDVQRFNIIKIIQLLSVETRKIVDNLYFNKNVISITNIYQKTYNNNKYASGFGDFIRGCYFMLDFCETFHFQPKIVINHPLNAFLENHSTTNNYDILKTVSMFEDNNCNKHILNDENVIINTIRKNETITKFINYLDTSPIDNRNINIYNIVFPYLDVSSEHQHIMRNILKPSQEMNKYIMYTLANLELTEKNYIIIHIRSGDNYLHCTDTQFNSTYLTDITNNIIVLLDKHPNAYFLLIADNKFIKLYFFSKKLHRLYIMFNEIGHLGENTQLDRNQIKNTMLDFYLFAYSSIIYAFSSYDHGSGFSWWCAKTYNVPYSCKIIKP